MTVAAQLESVVGRDHLLTDPDTRQGFERDWTGAFVGCALAVVRPATTEEVAEVVRICGAAGVPLVPQGGNTGLVGGSVPDDSGSAVVLSTRRLGGIEDSGIVGAGVTLAALQADLAPRGLSFAVDLAPRDSATIGGMVATNAGGVHVLRHGMMRRQLLGVEAVLGDGSVVAHLSGLEKDNTGYDLASLLCGSEGTLGVVTRARLRCVTRPTTRETALLGFGDLAGAVAALEQLRRTVELDAAEYMVRRGVTLVCETLGLTDPFEAEVYLLVEAESGLLDAIESEPAVVAQRPAERDGLWALRERHTEALTLAGPPRKYDVAVPDVAGFVPEALALVESHDGAVCHHFGHLADGNVHLNVLGRFDDDAGVLSLVAAHGGSISAEHGIGRLKRPWLHLCRSPAELAAFAAIKHALDPHDILNPGVLI